MNVDVGGDAARTTEARTDQLDPGKAPRIRSRIVRTKIATSMARDRKLAVSQGLVGYLVNHPTCIFVTV